MLYTGIFIIIATMIWDWTSSSDNKIAAIYYRIPAAISIILILIPVYVKRLQRHLVDVTLVMSFISLCCLFMNYLLLPERTPYLPAILYYFMSSFLVFGPVVPTWKLVMGIFTPIPLIAIYLNTFNQTEQYAFSIFMHVIPTHAFLLLTALQVKRNAEQNYTLFCQTYQLATLDSLTNLLNRRAWEQQADHALQRSIRDHTSFAIVTGDIDFFKQVNDKYGHPVGDVVIKSVAQCLKQHLRSYDLVGRLGGDEFVIAFPNIEKTKLTALCERMRSAIEGLIIHTETGERVNTTISLGISFSQENSKTLYPLMKQSDIALYKAKRNGRNQVAHN